MKRVLASLITGLACTGAAWAEVNVQPGDMAFGLNNSSATLTLEQVRTAGTSPVDRWRDLGFVQSTEFDNFGGVLHNSGGNLLSLNFGTSTLGGDLNMHSTDGSDNSTKILDFDGNNGNPLTRVSGLSVSPDNTKLAVFASNSGRVLIYTYNAGATVGTGAGASATFLVQSAAIADITATQTCGTAWLDASTVLAYVVADGTAGTMNQLHTINASTGANTLRATITMASSGNRFLDVEFHPTIAPGLIFCSASRFATPTTTNLLTVLNSGTFAVVDSVNYGTSSDTLREIGFGPDKRLYAATFDSDIDFLVIDANSDGSITPADIPLIPDNSSTLFYSSTTSGNFVGLDVAHGTADTTGACCLSESNCMQLTSAQCLAQTGMYRGNGTSCSTPGICLPPTGACCISGMGCLDAQTAIQCDTQGGEYQGNNTLCGPDTCFLEPLPVIPNDLALGLSNANILQTAWQVRNGLRVGGWTMFPFLQSMEFDNTAGVLHNADGNLLALNFGAGGVAVNSPPTCSDPARPQEGGNIHQLPTDGTDGGTELYRFNTLLGGVACTRIGGLGVSADNAFISVVGTDSADVYVLEYDEGPTPGTGAGAAIGNEFTLPAVAFAGITQGTTWFDNNTLMIYTPDPLGDPFAATLRVVDFNGSTFGPVATVLVLFNSSFGGSRFTDVEYNPEVSPYIYAAASSFSGGVTTNFLSIIDPTSSPNPNTWTVIRTLDLSTGTQSLREIAMGPDGRLYLGEFAQGGSPQLYVDVLDLDLNNDGTITLAETNALTNNSAVDYFSLNGGVGASFTGLDVAHGTADPCGMIVCGDSNLSGNVSVGDIGFFVTAVANGFAAWDALIPGVQTMQDFLCANDTDGNGAVTVGDIGRFVGVVTGSSSCQ